MHEIEKQEIVLRRPVSEDGVALFRLVRQCPPLDVNSLYCNLLHCSHFAATSVAAVEGDELAGFISGYIMPEQPDTLFIWQVAVGEKARGRGLATRMLQHILQRPQCDDVAFLETTITGDNRASWALFEGFAAKMTAAVSTSVMFDRALHFDGRHETEQRVRIGPLARNNGAEENNGPAENASSSHENRRYKNEDF